MEEEKREKPAEDILKIKKELCNKLNSICLKLDKFNKYIKTKSDDEGQALIENFVTLLKDHIFNKLHKNEKLLETRN